jgi:hypothetical protein
MPRGTDFTARWSEGAWAEAKIIEAINKEASLIAVPYGISDGEAFWSIRDMEARELPDQTKHGKRPDVLVFERSQITAKELAIVEKVCELDDDSCEAIVRKAKLAIESEFSPYDYERRLTNYGKELSYTVKDEDLGPIAAWRSHHGVEIGITQVFLDSAYMLPLGVLLAGIKDGTIKRKIEGSYKKPVYYPNTSRGIPFGVFRERPSISAELIVDPYGKHHAYRKVEGGELELTDELKAFLAKIRRVK